MVEKVIVLWLARTSLLSIGLTALSGCAEDGTLEASLPGSPETLRNTPMDEYASELPYKFVYENGELFLKFTPNDSEPFGPYRKTSSSRYEYAGLGRGVHSVRLSDKVWWHSDTFLEMRSQEVDATEL